LRVERPQVRELGRAVGAADILERADGPSLLAGTEVGDREVELRVVRA
jgi:hypothetical protein